MAMPQFWDNALASSSVYSWTLALRCASLLIMAATTSLAMLSSDETRSQTSSMYSQFSEVRFSSVALAISTDQLETTIGPVQ